MKLVVSFLPYGLAAGLCFLLVTSGRRDCTHTAKTVQIRAWKILCLFLLLPGVLRPFAMHSRITAELKTSAITGGWYAERTGQQLDLLLVLGFLFAVCAAFLLFETRRWHASTRLGIAAAMFLLVLLVLNILSLHGLDRLLGRALAGISLRWLLDITGLGLFVAAACWFRTADRAAVC